MAWERSQPHSRACLKAQQIECECKRIWGKAKTNNSDTLNLHLKVYLAGTIILKKKIAHLLLGLFQGNIFAARKKKIQALQEDLKHLYHCCQNWDTLWLWLLGTRHRSSGSLYRSLSFSLPPMICFLEKKGDVNSLLTEWLYHTSSSSHTRTSSLH